MTSSKESLRLRAAAAKKGVSYIETVGDVHPACFVESMAPLPGEKCGPASILRVGVLRALWQKNDSGSQAGSPAC